jgi:uncharacterized protein (DUF305 family)
MKNLIPLTLLISVALALSGCSTAAEVSYGDKSYPTTKTDTSVALPYFSGLDVMFAQMMIPHHQQAVEMAILAESRALSSEVKNLAVKIKAEQDPEIAEMKSWLRQANAPDDMGHEMDMDGMLSNGDMTRLGLAEGSEFDQLFIEGMIEHHKGAIEMVDMISNSNNQVVKALGVAIVEAQTKEILELEALLD